MNILKSGTTSKLDCVYITNLSTGAPITGATYSSVTISYFINNGTTVTHASAVTMTVGTWVTLGFKEVDSTNFPGLYQVGVPNAVFASYATFGFVSITGITGQAPCVIKYEVSGCDINDPVHLGVTALPNAAIGAVGGLTTAKDTNGNAGLQLSDSAQLQTGTAVAGSTSTTLALAATAVATTGYYVGAIAKISSGTGVGQSRVITAYNSSRVATVNSAWAVTPDATSVYTILASDVDTSTVGGYVTGQDPATLVLDTADTVDNPTNCSTPRQWFRVMIAALAGQVSGAATSTVVVKNINGATKTRISATVDSSGDRSAIGTLDGT